MKTKCCGYSPKDKEYLEAVVQELIYMPTTTTFNELERMELQGQYWIKAWAKVQGHE